MQIRPACVAHLLSPALRQLAFPRRLCALPDGSCAVASTSPPVPPSPRPDPGAHPAVAAVQGVAAFLLSLLPRPGPGAHIVLAAVQDPTPLV